MNMVILNDGCLLMSAQSDDEIESDDAFESAPPPSARATRRR